MGSPRPGITHAKGYCTAPSAGALYPLELYVVAGNAEGLADGVYYYNAKQHDLTRSIDIDLREELAAAAYFQDWIEQASAIIVFTAIPECTTKKYGERAERYVYIEAGHAAQNLFNRQDLLDWHLLWSVLLMTKKSLGCYNFAIT